MATKRHKKHKKRGVVLAAVLVMLAVAWPVDDIRGASETPTLSAEQTAALKGLDAALARFEALLEQDDDAQHKAAAKKTLEEFKARRTALRSSYEQARYDELRWDLNVEYQRLANWVGPPKTPPPKAKAKPER